MDAPGSSLGKFTEIGSLTSHAPDASDFVGSSSGVYFIQTVKKAFAFAIEYPLDGGLPPAEATVGGSEDTETVQDDSSSREADAISRLYLRENGADISICHRTKLGCLPSQEIARQLAIEYFKHWHPIFPFLSGPHFLTELTALYTDGMFSDESCLTDRQRLCSFITVQCVLNIGAAKFDSTLLPRRSLIRSPEDLLAAVVPLAFRHDIQTIQTIMAAQLYCVSTMALRTASSLGGVLLRLIVHSGLHRCPFRYNQLSIADRALRKRIFWSAYAMDRYFCQALGLPLGIADTDIDVCVPTHLEVHRPPPLLGQFQGVVDDHSSGLSSNNMLILSSVGPNVPNNVKQLTTQNFDSQDQVPAKEVILASYVEYGELVGRALEIYHKAIHVRSITHEKVLFLRSDIDQWFNNLPEQLQSITLAQTPGSELSHFTLFFVVSYNQLKILVNRPTLSLDRSLPEFHSGLQTSLSSARATIAALEQQDYLYWPGYLAAVWMSGLIIAFACQVQAYSVGKGIQEIQRCLELLKSMASRLRTASHCHQVLTALLQTLRHSDSSDHSISNRKATISSLKRSRPPSPRYSSQYQSASSTTTPPNYTHTTTKRQRRSENTQQAQNESSVATALNSDPEPILDANVDGTSGMLNSFVSAPVNTQDQAVSSLDDMTLGMSDIFQDITWDSLLDLDPGDVYQFQF